jgi:hypothetical protein
MKDDLDWLFEAPINKQENNLSLVPTEQDLSLTSLEELDRIELEKITKIAIAVNFGTNDKTFNIPGLAKDLDIPVSELVMLMNSPKFSTAVRAVTKAQSMLVVHGKGIQKLTDIVYNGKDKDVLAALKMLGVITGDLRSGKNVDVTVTFDDLRKSANATDSPLSNLFKIQGQEHQDADFIDSEFEEIIN